PVRRMGCDAMLAGTEYGMNPVEAVEGGASATWLALVARIHRVAKVVAASPQQQVPAGRGHVAQLRGRSGEQRLREHGIFLLHDFVMREIAVAYHRSDAPSAVGSTFDFRQRQAVDVEHGMRVLDI